MTEARRVRFVDAFTDEPLAGVPTSVVPNATDLTDDQLAAVAGELGARTTTFVLPGDETERRLRFFTGAGERDRGVGATVAAFATLFERALVERGSYRVETPVGTTTVEVAVDGTVWVGLDGLEHRALEVAYDTVGTALGVDTAALSEVGQDLPIARASTGLPVVVVPVGYFEQLSGLDPEPASLADLCERENARGVYAFTFDTLGGESTLHGRLFAERAGYREVPADGAAGGSVGAYLRLHGALDEADPLLFEQGHFVDRPGVVRVRTDDDVQVGGRTVTVFDGELTIPAAGDDDIIEA